MSSPAPIRPGTILQTESGARLRVEAWRGEGSFARVYRGTLLAGSRACAVKVARSEVPEAAARLEHERRVLTVVQHPHLVRLLDHGHAPESPFLCLDWLEGETLLEEVSRRRRLPLRTALEIFSQLSEAVAAFHSRHEWHGDVRPENVILTREAGAVLTDPGPPVDSPSTESLPVQDLRRLVDLLALMLTGRPPDTGETCLSPSDGFNPRVVELWQRTQDPTPAAARDLHLAAEQLRRSL